MRTYKNYRYALVDEETIRKIGNLKHKSEKEIEEECEIDSTTSIVRGFDEDDFNELFGAVN